MGLGRRKIGIDDPSAWVFNRMADVYDARPPYPDALVDALGALAPPGGHVGDLGAGIGHLTLPLAARGLRVTAVEPAREMLMRLERAARARALAVDAVHAAAEATPLASGSLDLALVADAVHFLDAERAGREIGRTLRPGGALALLTCQLADTPFMHAVVAAMEDAAPRRPRTTRNTIAQLGAVAGITWQSTQHFEDETAVDHETLERILRSISFIGPAMNAARFEAFRARVRTLSDAPRWARTFQLRIGRKRS